MRAVIMFHEVFFSISINFHSFSVISLAGFSAQPAQSALGETTLSVTATIITTENVRCVAVASNDMPTATQVNAGENSAGSTLATGLAPAAQSATGGSVLTTSFTGLTAATMYDVFCATVSGVKSAKVSITTNPVGTLSSCCMYGACSSRMSCNVCLPFPVSFCFVLFWFFTQGVASPLSLLSLRSLELR
jgi:hypothetical protein